MKKIIIVLFIISLFVLVNKNDEVVIPKEHIRYRIIANSDSFKDQEQKLMIKNEVDEVLNNIMLESNNIDDTRYNINRLIPKIEKIIDKYNVLYDIKYGNNYFPEKEYKGIKYDAGFYESLVITLGSGLGENFWCVMFPPLCLLEYDKDNIDDVDYQLFAKKVIEKFK